MTALLLIVDLTSRSLFVSCGISIIYSDLGNKVPSHQEEILLLSTEAAHRDLRKKEM